MGTAKAAPEPHGFDLPGTTALLTGQVGYPEPWRWHLIQQTPLNVPQVVPVS